MQAHPWTEPDLLRGAGVRLWWLPPEAGTDGPGAESDEADHALLSPDESARAQRFRFPRHRIAFVRRRAFLRRILGELSSTDPARLRFCLGPFGKPHLMGGGPSFNLSHSEGAALLATALRGAVGVDVECARPRTDHDGVARRVASPAELRVWERLEDAQRLGAFLRLWTRKESVLKVTGEGLQRDPASFSVGLEERAPDVVTVIELDGEEAIQLVDLAPPAPYFGALALRGI